jgi:hypothetical protein
MTTTSNQDRAFESMQTVLSLDEAVDWIGSNLVPKDVFAEAELQDWATDNGYIKDTNGN